MDSGVHRRRRPPAGRAGRTDAGISQGAHRHWDDRTAGHRSPGGPPGVHNGPGRPPGARRHGTRKPGATAVRLRPRGLAVGPGPYQPSGPEQPGTAPAAPPSGRRMAKAPGHRRQLSIPALPQAGGAAGTQPRGRDAGHPAGRLVPSLPAPAPRRPEPPAPRRGRVEKSGERTPPGLQPRRVPVEFPGPGRLGVSAHHRQPQAQAACRVPVEHRGGLWVPGKPGRRAATGRVRRAAARLVDPAGNQDQARHPGQGQDPGHAGRLRHDHDLP